MSGEPPRASSYTREFLQRVKSSTWEKRYVLGAVFLGQFLSLCLCGTGVTSQLLVTDHDISVPTTQCFLNYLLLGLTFGVHFATKKRYMKVLKYNWWKYIVLGVVDVEANFLIVLAYRYTNLTSIQLLDCFTILVVMILSYVFLKTRYKLINVMGVLLTVIGIACLVFADFNSSRNNGGSAMFLGDMLCLVAAILYAAGNVTQEYLVKSHSVLEYLGLIGVVGSFVSGAQLIALERMSIARIQWSPAVGGLFSGFGVSLFLFYSLTPWVIRMSNAVLFNLSLLTADFYSLLFGIFLFDYNFSGFYAMGFCLVVLGIFIYNLRHPLEKKLKKRSEETRREKSIERMFSVATTKLESSTETGDMEWKVRRLLESSTGNSTSDSIGILSRSFQVKMPHYGGTPRATELKHTGSFSLSHYDSCREGPLPFWGGQNNRRDDGEEDHHHGNGYYGHRVRPRIEIEAGSDSVRFSQSVPMCGEGEREGEPEGKEERNYSRQRGVGEEEREPKKRRNSDSLTHPHPQQQRRRRGSREGTPANRKHRRRRNEALSSPHKARARSSDEEEEEETTGLMFSPDLVQDRVDTKATDTTGGGRGGFN